MVKRRSLIRRTTPGKLRNETTLARALSTFEAPVGVTRPRWVRERDQERDSQTTFSRCSTSTEKKGSTSWLGTPLDSVDCRWLFVMVT